MAVYLNNKKLTVPIYIPAEDLHDELNKQKTLIKDIKTLAESLEEYTDLSVTTATEEDVIKGKTFFSGNSEIKTGMLVIDGIETIEIELPQEFYDSYDLYYYAVNQDTVLISTPGYIGLWVYHVNAKTLEKKWSGGSSWQKFYQITDDLVLITSSQSPSSTLLYDVTTDTVSTIGISFAGTLIIQQVSENKFLITGANSSQSGIYSFDTITKTGKKIHNAGYYFKNFAKVGSSWLVSSPYTLGVYRYNILEDTLESIYQDNTWDWFNVINNECFISSTKSNTGILKYNDDDKTIKSIYDVGYNWRYISKVSDKIFVSSSSSSYAGLYLIENDELVKIYETGYAYQYFHTINDRVIISNSSKTALIYDFKDGSVLSLSAPISDMKYGIALKDRVLLLSNSTGYTPLAVYYYETNEVKQHPTLIQFAYYDTLKQDGDNCYISSSKSGYSMVAYYTYADDSIKLIGAKLEV